MHKVIGVRMIKLTLDERPDRLTNFEKPEVLGDVRAWSYSALKVFEDHGYGEVYEWCDKLIEVEDED